MTTRIRLRGPADIITVLPYHLGYRPTDSLVVVCLEGRRVAFVGRLDLPPPDLDPRAYVEELLTYVVGEQPDRVVVVGFESEPGRADPASAAMRDALDDAQVTVAERLLVRDQRWWSLDCDLPCCPDEGEPLPREDDVPAIADYVLLGRRPAQSRADLARRLDPIEDLAGVERRCVGLLADLAAATRSRTALRRMRRQALAHWGELLDVGDAEGDRSPRFTDDAWARMAVSLRDVQLRDLVIAWLCPGTLEVDLLDPGLVDLAVRYLPPSGQAPGRTDEEWLLEQDHLVERLSALCRQTPTELSPGPLTLLASVTWWLGDGALTRVALERALSVDPSYTLARLLERMVDFAVRPRRSA